MKKPDHMFAAKVATTLIVGAILLVAVPLGIVSCAMKEEHNEYYRIQRLNIYGEVQQTYYSQSFPWSGENCTYFKEYPSGKFIEFSAPYTAEDLGTNKPQL